MPGCNRGFMGIAPRRGLSLRLLRWGPPAVLRRRLRRNGGIGAVARPIGGAGLRRLSEVLLVLLLVRMMRRGLRGELLRFRLIGVEHLRCGARNGEGLRVWPWPGRAAPLTTSYNDCHRDESDDHERSDAADDPGQELAGRQRGGRTVLALYHAAREIGEADGVSLLVLDLSAIALGHLPGKRSGIGQSQLR